MALHLGFEKRDSYTYNEKITPGVQKLWFLGVFTSPIVKLGLRPTERLKLFTVKRHFLLYADNPPP
jgi:hypothetical protein